MVLRLFSNSLNLLFGGRYIVPTMIFLDFLFIISRNIVSISPEVFSGTRSFRNLTFKSSLVKILIPPPILFCLTSLVELYIQGFQNYHRHCY